VLADVAGGLEEPVGEPVELLALGGDVEFTGPPQDRAEKPLREPRFRPNVAALGSGR
jgi:hypothetical protein